MRVIFTTAIVTVLLAILCARGETPSPITAESTLLPRDNNEYLAYHDNGVVQVRGRVVDGMRAGLWIYADRDGYICGYEEYRGGRPVESRGQLPDIANR